MVSSSHSLDFAKDWVRRDDPRGKTKRLGNIWKLVLLLGLVFEAACSPFPTGINPPAGAGQAALLFADDFSKTSGGWGRWSRDGAVVDYHNSGLRIQVNETQFDFWSVAGKNYEDVRIEVDASKIGGPDDNDFGIICRYQNRENFYMLVVSSDGYYGIAKLKNGQYGMIGADQLQYSDVIARGLAVNRLRADCVGDTLTIYVNNQKLMEARDTDYPNGDVGLLAGAYDIQGVDILFDNFMVKKP